MSTPIDPQRFDGMRGLHVQDDQGRKGELDPNDIVVDAGGHRLAWDDAAYKDAREAFAKNQSLLCSYKSSLQGIQKALDTPSADKPSKKGVQQVLDGAACLRKDAPAAQRSDASTLMAWCEGIIAQHYTTFPWSKAEPGERAIADLKQAIRDNSQNRDAAFSLAATLLAIRNNKHRELVEKYIHIDTAGELLGLLPRLAADEHDLRAQCVYALAMGSLERDGKLPASYAHERPQLDQRIAALRAADPNAAHQVDSALSKFREAKK